MCGRFAIRNPEPVKRQFQIETLEPQYNICPGTKILAVTDHAQFIKWGFTPYWAKEPFNLINARGESLWKKPSFRNSSRCLIPADGWYEWKQEEGQKIPYFHYLGESNFCFAGIYGGYRGEMGCAIVTLEATVDLQSIHSRMPAILDKTAYDQWIKGDEDDVYDLSISEKIEFHQVSTIVNNPSNNV
ncbi:MAG TPA: SOS response-associated peptidase, partial [Gammaproteobacteria bacterium]|nr:SOS response-associated peptidase [Gammaproteobacteria bacterium]